MTWDTCVVRFTPPKPRLWKESPGGQQVRGNLELTLGLCLSQPEGLIAPWPQSLDFLQKQLPRTTFPKMRANRSCPSQHKDFREDLLHVAPHSWQRYSFLSYPEKTEHEGDTGNQPIVPIATSLPAVAQWFMLWEKWSWKMDMRSPNHLWSSSASMLTAKPGVKTMRNGGTLVPSDMRTMGEVRSLWWSAWLAFRDGIYVPWRGWLSQ